MLTRIFFLASLLFTISACKNLAPRFEYQAEPQNAAWYLRTHIEPLARKVAGIPVQLFNPDWCFANELRLEDFPPELAQKLAENRKSQLESSFTQVDFKLKQPFGLQGPDYISIGVFHNCTTNDYGTFVFAIKHEKLLDVLVGFGSSNFGILSTQDQANQNQHNDKTVQNSSDTEVFWQSCFNCDGGANITWDATRARFGEIKSAMPADD